METSERTFYIYCHTAPNGKRYVGQTCQRPETRWSNGNGYKDQTYFSRAIAKYGWDNFRHEILCVVHSKKVADLFEQHYIAKFDTFNEEHGYNLTMGGGGCLGHKVSDETREKLSKISKGKVVTDEQRRRISEKLRAGYASGEIVVPPKSEEALRRMSAERTGEGNPMYGKHHSEEAVAKIVATHLGRKNSPETRKRMSEARYRSPNIKRRQVDQFDLDGNYIATYPSIKVAAKAVGDFESSISNCVRGKQRRSKQFRWRYHEDTEFAYEAIRMSRLSS